MLLQVQNSKCQTIRDKTRSRYLKTTEEGIWREEQVALNSGVNRLYWRAFSTSLDKPQLRKNVMIQKVEVIGMWSSCLLINIRLFRIRADTPQQKNR